MREKNIYVSLALMFMIHGTWKAPLQRLSVIGENGSDSDCDFSFELNSLAVPL